MSYPLFEAKIVPMVATPCAFKPKTANSAAEPIIASRAVGSFRKSLDNRISRAAETALTGTAQT